MGLEWLDPLPTGLARFRLQDMRYRWRKRTFLPANWKTVIDAFIEGLPRARHPSADHAIGGRSTAVRRARTATGVRLRSLHPNHHVREPLPVRLHAASRVRRPRKGRGPIVALRPSELPLTPFTKRRDQTHRPPVIRRELPTNCGDFRPFGRHLEPTKITETRT